MMIGKTIESRPALPIVSMALTIALAVFLDGLALYFNNYHFALASLMPWMLALGIWLGRERLFRALITENGLEVENPQRTIPFAEFNGLHVRGRPTNPFKMGKKNFPILILFGKDSIWLPATLNVPSEDLYLFLLQQFPTETAQPVDPAMEAFRARKEALYGADRVWCYTPREKLKGRPYRTSYVLIMAFQFFVGICWLTAGIQLNAIGWAIAGATTASFAGIWLAFSLNARKSPLRNWHRASLVICPDSMALLQGDLNGQLTWRELLDVKLRGSSFMLHHIRLKVAGVEILIHDFFNRPLTLIYQHIFHYWRGDSADQDHDRSLTVLPVDELDYSKKIGITPGFLPNSEEAFTTEN